MTSFDLETHVGTRGVHYPRAVCSVAGSVIATGAESVLQQFLSTPAPIPNTYLAYDVGVLLEHARDRPEVVRAIWERMRAGDLYGVDVAEQLLDIAVDAFDRHETQGYSQVNVARWNGLGDGVAKSDTWRLFFGQLDGVPERLWPEGARNYLLADGDTPERVHARQLERGVDPVAVARETYCQVVLGLVASYGVRANRGRVDALKRNVEARIEGYRGRLVEVGLVRKDGTKDTKAAKRRMVDTCARQGIPVVLTDTGQERAKHGPLTPEETVEFASLERDTCILALDEDLITYAEYGSAKLLRGRADDLAEGIDHPLQTSFTSLRNTGRTSSRKPKDPHVGHQAQNWPRGAVKVRDLTTPTGWRSIDIGARECLEPRPGYTFLWGDFEAAEMHTLAEACLHYVGFSKLGDLLNAGVDPHAFFGGFAFERFTGTPQQIAAQVKALGDKPYKLVRNKSKPVNFGKPGGMGNRKWCAFARKQYDQIFSLQEAAYYGSIWFQLFPEVKKLHNLVGEWCDQQGGKCDMQLPPHMGGYKRGRCYFPAACNFTFQAPAAFAAKQALCQVAYECWAVPESPLFGCRPVNLVHDEIVTECPTERIHVAGVRLREIMREAFNAVTPHYKTDVEVIAGEVWSKSAKPVYNADGTLGIYRLAA